MDKKEVFRSNNIIKITFIVSALLIFGAVQAYAVVSGQQMWVKRYNGPGNSSDKANAIAIDSNNNVYVAGRSNGDSSYSDYAVIKYDSEGNQKWIGRYNGPGNSYDEAKAIAIDSRNNVYVAGGSYGGSTWYDYAVIKYDSEGNQKWIRRYDYNNSGDEARAIAIDSSDNVYVAGYSYGDFALIKYDSEGNQKWIGRYNGPGSNNDIAEAIAIDSSDNVYVAGSSDGDSSYSDYAVIKYDSEGNQKWIGRYNGPGNSYDEAKAIAIDSRNNIYVAGGSYGVSTIEDLAVIKYDSEGNQKWVRRYDYNNFCDSAEALAVDSHNNVYVAGYSDGGATGYDYVVIKYGSVAGNQKWVERYNGTENSDDDAYAIAIDGSDNVYVAGRSDGGATGFDFAVIKYDSVGSRKKRVKWVERYNGTGNGYDEARDIAVDNNNNVYVAGYSDGGATGYDYAVIKYAP